MRTVDQWLSEYGESHRMRANKVLHWICVPVIVVSLIGLLWSLPVPQAMRDISPLLNWGTLVLLAGVLYYFAMSWSLALGMAVFVVRRGVCRSLWLQRLPWPLWIVCLRCSSSRGSASSSVITTKASDRRSSRTCSS